MTTPTTPAPETIPPARPSGLYPLPANTSEALRTWEAIGNGTQVLDPHRAYLKRLVAEALRDGLSYDDQLDARVTADLGDLLTDELRERNDERVRVRGGVIGMEIHLARQQLRHEQEQRDLAAAHERVNPQPGQRLGALIWHDGKRSVACEITHVDGLSVTLTGRRGSQQVTVCTHARYIEAAQKRTQQRQETLASR